MLSNWKRHKLGKIASLRKQNITPENFNNEKYIGLEHIGQGNFLLEGIGVAADVTSNKSRFFAGDILYGKIRPYFKKVYRPQFSGICSTDILVIYSINHETVRQEYLYQIIKTQFFTDKATETSSGTKMPRADWNSLCNIEFDLPPLNEQQAIAEILSALDDKIELNLQTNKTLEDIANALYKHWFVDFGPFLPKGRSLNDGKGPIPGFVESELGWIPEGWLVKSLDDVAEFLNGIALQKFPPTGDNDLPVIKIRELKNGITNSTDFATNDIPEKYKLKNGDILFSWSGTLELVVWCNGRGALNQHLFKVTPLELPAWLIYMYVNQHMENFKLIAANKATTMGHIQRVHLTKAKICIPNSESFHNLDKTISPIYDLIIKNNIENNALKETRDYLLPKLISGEIRVKEATKKVQDLV